MKDIITKLNELVINIYPHELKVIRLEEKEYKEFDDFIRINERKLYGIDRMHESEYGLCRKFRGIPVLLKE